MTPLLTFGTSAASAPTSGRKPFQLVSWRADFVAALARRVAEETGGDLSRALVLVPHARPVRFLKAALAALPDLPRPAPLPRMLALDEFIDHLARDLRDRPLRRIGRLDQTGLLFEAVDAVRGRGHGPLSALPLSRERFLPWGARLAGLFEELFRQDRDPANLPYMEGEVIPWAAALLEQLGDIHAAYLSLLAERGLTTSGLDARLAAREAIGPDGAASRFVRGQQVFLAGFYALGGAEEALFRHLWAECGAEVLWHGDPALADDGPGGRVHHCEAEHLAWKRRWGARVELLDSGQGEDPANGPALRFVEGFDLHSQLAELARELDGLAQDRSTAVVLPETRMLGPVLHHLPDREVNISMGAALSDSALAQLLEIVLALREGRVEPDEPGGRARYPRKEMVALLRHPYVKMPLTTRAPELKPVLHAWEIRLREGGPLADPWDFLPAYGGEGEEAGNTEAAEALRAAFLDHFLTAFARVGSLDGLGQALERLVLFLHDLGEPLWHTHLLDAETLSRLAESVIPQLRGCLVSAEEYPLAVLFGVLRDLLAAERVSFEPEPLTGLQVLGFLETRLLRFDRLYVLEAVEEVLPGSPAHDPLLPDPLRGLLGLPDSRERDHVAAYNFHRLIAGAREAVVFYQAGVKPGLLDGKSVRSRYVEELVWDWEKKHGRRTGDRDGLIKVLSFPARPPEREVAPAPLTPAARERLEALILREGLSPSALDAYLRCPKAFYFRYLARLSAPRAMPGEPDRGLFGSLLHRVLEQFFAPRLGQDLDFASLPEAERAALSLELGESFGRALDQDPFLGHLAYDRRACLAFTGRERLARFLAALPPTRILEQEEKMSARLALGGHEILLRGQPDRLDLRQDPDGNRLLLLDYKTGKVPRPATGFWEDDELFEELADCDPARDPDPELLARLAKSAGSVQLPAYLLLLEAARPELPEVLQAGWVELADKGAEATLFPERLSLAERRALLTGRIPDLLGFLIRHLLGCTSFVAVRGPGCRFCDMGGPCGAPEASL